MSQFWRCDPEWEGETAFVIGCGPSARDFDATVLLGRRVIALKNYCEVAPWADMTFFADNHWWREYCENKPGYGPLGGFKGDIVTIATAPTDADAKALNLKRMKKTGTEGIETQLDSVRIAFTSLQAALCICAHRAVSRIVLATGFDMESPGGRTHYHKGHKRRTDPGHYARMIRALSTTVQPLSMRGIEVFNCTPGGRLELWPRAPLERFL